MKKIVITLLLGYSFSFASECQKFQIDELKYMKKEELIDEYKKQMAFVNITESYIDSMRDISRQEHSLNLMSTALGSKKNNNSSSENKIEKAENEKRCYEKNQDNIKRVLEKDFNVTEKELNENISKMK